VSQEKTVLTDTAGLIRHLQAWPEMKLIGIDGLPVSGKSTLADKLVEAFGAQVIYLDDFVLPQGEWPQPTKPAFPFPYMRHEAFFAAVETLARTESCRYQLYDWETGGLGPWKEVQLGKALVIVEGVSALSERLTPLYDLKAWVESDAATTLQASIDRGVGSWEREWRDLFMPSVALYMETDPQKRADLVVAGRGT